MFKTDLDDTTATPGAGRNRQRDEEQRQMNELGVAFDGRGYWYHEYRYDKLADALAYARLDRARPDYQPKIHVYPEWRQPERPTAEQERTMADLGIDFDGRHYRYREYRYDHFVDAINYAQLKK